MAKQNKGGDRRTGGTSNGGGDPTPKANGKAGGNTNGTGGGHEGGGAGGGVTGGGAAALTLSAGWDRSVVWEGGGSVRYLVMTLAARAASKAVTRKPLNLALVIDKSGSMSGGRLEAAKAAAATVISCLRDDDRVSVATFSSEAKTVVHAERMGPLGKERASAKVGAIVTDGNTALAAGWLLGAELVASAPDADATALRHLVLLSDGHANSGETDPRKLTDIAVGLRDRGLTSSCVGVGDGYSTAQLEAICEGGGGRLHDAATPEEMAEVVLGELGDLAETVAEEVKLTVGFPGECVAELLGATPCVVDRARGVLEVSFGKVAAGTTRTVVVKFTTPGRAAGASLAFSAGLAFTDAVSGERSAQDAPAEALTLSVGTEAENTGQRRAMERSLTAAAAWCAHSARHAINLNRDGEYERAKVYLQDQLRHFERYCTGVEGGQVLVADLKAILERIDFDWDERSRKSVQTLYSKALSGDRDHRVSIPEFSFAGRESMPRSPVQDFLPRKRGSDQKGGQK